GGGEGCQENEDDDVAGGHDGGRNDAWCVCDIVDQIFKLTDSTAKTNILREMKG
ncbi:hypothetical protein Tco_1200052, partial [Tanacetum coccineum]